MEFVHTPVTFAVTPENNLITIQGTFTVESMQSVPEGVAPITEVTLGVDLELVGESEHEVIHQFEPLYSEGNPQTFAVPGEIAFTIEVTDTHALDLPAGDYEIPRVLLYAQNRCVAIIDVVPPVLVPLSAVRALIMESNPPTETTHPTEVTEQTESSPETVSAPDAVADPTTVPAPEQEAPTESPAAEELVAVPAPKPLIDPKTRYPILTRVGLCPVKNLEFRLVGSLIQGSQDGKLWTTLTTVPPPQPTAGEITFYNSPYMVGYKFLRVLSAPNAFCTVAEVQFFSNQVMLTGELIASQGTYRNQDTPASHAFDGDLTTHFQAFMPFNGFVGIELDQIP